MHQDNQDKHEILRTYLGMRGQNKCKSHNKDHLTDLVIALMGNAGESQRLTQHSLTLLLSSVCTSEMILGSISISEI